MSENILRIASHLGQAALEEVPGAKIVHAALTETSILWREHLTRRFLEDLAVRIAQNEADPAATAGALKENWAQEAIQRGWMTMMQAVDEEARASVAALVALYLKDRRGPDRIYKRVGSLLAESSGEELAALLPITSAVVAVSTALPGRHSVYVMSSHDHDRKHCVASFFGRKEAHVRFSISGELSPLFVLLYRHGMGVMPAGATMSFSREDILFEEQFQFMPGEHIDAAEVLMQCIRAPNSISPAVTVEEPSDAR